MGTNRRWIWAAVIVAIAACFYLVWPSVYSIKYALSADKIYFDPKPPDCDFWQAWADPQSEISVYRKSHGLSTVTEDAKLSELAASKQMPWQSGVRWITMCMHPFALV